MQDRDPIVEEPRKLREEYAAKFSHDPDRIFKDILKRQEGKRLVCFRPREPRFKPTAA